MKRFTKRWSLRWLMISVALPGCGQKQAPVPADPDQGRAVLLAALTAWKDGGQCDQLKERRPPIIVNDPDWIAGRRLKRFQLADGHEYHGSQLRCAATLTFEGENGVTTEKKVTFLIDTSPVLVIVRGDM